MAGFTYKDYEESEALKKRQQALDQLQAPSAYTSGYSGKMDNLITDYANRKPFTYDVNGDALYQQYRDQYIRGGRLAMADTMGQAAALTGGYGNSYAAAAGNQAYQQYLGRLNEVVPQLYNLAYQRYQQEGQDMKDLYSMYQNKDSIDYGRYRDTYNDYLTDRNYLADRFDKDRTYEYGLYGDAYNRAFQAYQQQVAESQFDRELAYKYYAQDNTGSGRSSGGSSGGSYSGGSSGGTYAGQSTGDFSNGWKGSGSSGGSSSGSGSTGSTGSSADMSSNAKLVSGSMMTEREYSRAKYANSNAVPYSEYVRQQVSKAQSEGKITQKEAVQILKDKGV